MIFSNIDDNFPKESYREGQREAIEFAVKSFNDGKKIVILECPTGSGKSAIGMTLANMVSKSYYLTITKVLQDQLVDDFGSNIIELKGRNAYRCNFYDRYGDMMVERKLLSSSHLNKLKNENCNCNNGYCRSKFNSSENKFKCTKCFLKSGVDNTGKPRGELDNLPVGHTYSACPYYDQVYKAIKASKVLMNFSSFMFQTQMTTRFDEVRDLMIIDECHNIEPQLLDFVSFSINDTHLMEYGIELPQFEKATEYKEWFEANNLSNILLTGLKQAKDDGDTKKEDELSRLYQKYNLFLDNMNNEESEWICECSNFYNNSNNYNKVTFKPVFVKNFVHNLLFKYSSKILMMSATVLDVNVLCNSLGIDRKHVSAYRVKNRFPKSNRPIYLNTVAKMTGGKSRMHEWGPLLVGAIDKIANIHAEQKGIIHTHNFAIMDLIIKQCNKTVKNRLLDQRNFKDKNDLLKFHSSSIDPTIIIAPAMHEGIDLIGKLSEFQIICKVPYANCFDDKQLARRVEIDRKYYTWLTALKLVQSYGRSIRSKDDVAISYILDESIYRFLKEAGNMIPVWFTEAIVEKNA